MKMLDLDVGFAIEWEKRLGVDIMVMSSKQKLAYCEYYDRKTCRCTVDGTSWCAFPTSNYCELASDEQERGDGIPTVIRALLEVSYPEGESPIVPKLAARKIVAN